MVLLNPGEFLIELDKLFSATKGKGSVYVVMKRSAFHLPPQNHYARC
jgi:hypothetical protein